MPLPDPMRMASPRTPTNPPNLANRKGSTISTPNPIHMPPDLRSLSLALIVATTLIPASAEEAGGCSWPAKFEADSTNIAFPDDNANYWIARFVVSPGSELQITGTYPHARYFSFHVYDPSQAPVDGLADRDLDPDAAGENPFREDGAPHGTFSARVVWGDPPAVRAPNTIYAGRGDGSVNATETMLYRVYVGDDPASIEGSVPLPRLTLRTNDGSVEVPLGACEPLPPSTQDAVSDTIARANMPNEVPRGLPYPPEQSPPRFVKFWGTAHEFARRSPQGAQYAPKNGGFLSNLHINYLYALFSRKEGDMFVMRAKAPTAPDTRAGVPVSAERDLRYFSICQNELATQRFVGCLYDAEVVVDPDGYFTVVVSDPEDRPSNASNWLPWGGAYYDGNIIYRHMLPAAGFEYAIQRVPYGVDEATVMGEYFPRLKPCSKAAFESAGYQACGL